MTYFDDPLKDRTLFFATGEAKSGTTWLMNLLAGHPDIDCTGEDYFDQMAQHMVEAMNQYNAIFQREGHLPSNARSCRFDETDIEFLIRTLVPRLIARGAGAETRIIGSKFRQVFRLQDLVIKLFPEARIVQIVRDPRDVAMSFHAFSWKNNPEETEKTVPTLAHSVRRVFDFWQGTVGMIRNFGGPGREHLYHEIRYEDLKADALPVMTGVAEFLGADAAPGKIQAAIDAASFEKMSGGREAGREDEGSFFRKGVSGDWREKFDDDCHAAFEECADKELMREIGYID